MSAFSNML